MAFSSLHKDSHTYPRPPTLSNWLTTTKYNLAQSGQILPKMPTMARFATWRSKSWWSVPKQHQPKLAFPKYEGQWRRSPLSCIRGWKSKTSVPLALLSAHSPIYLLGLPFLTLSNRKKNGGIKRLWKVSTFKYLWNDLVVNANEQKNLSFFFSNLKKLLGQTYLDSMRKTSYHFPKVNC